MPTASPRTTKAAEWILAGASVSLVLAAAAGVELALRTAHPRFLRHTHVDHPHVYSQTYGWALRPGARYEGRQGEIITVNPHGYRGPEHLAAPAPGVRRVVMLGDSVTFGTGVSDGQTFSDRLETQGGYDVVNLAVDGYGTDQELIRLEQEGFAYHPDVVVLNFCIRNDYFDNALPVALYDGRSPKPYFTLEDGRLVRHDAHLRIGRATRAAVALNEGSYLINALMLLNGRPVILDDGGPDEDWGDRREAVLADFPRAAALTRRLVEGMAEECRGHGTRFLLVLHPDRRAFSGDGTLVAPMAGLNGIRTVDMAREYTSRGLGFEAVAFDRLGHLSAAGHAAAAAILRDLLEGPGR